MLNDKYDALNTSSVPMQFVKPSILAKTLKKSSYTGNSNIPIPHNFSTQFFKSRDLARAPKKAPQNSIKGLVSSNVSNELAISQSISSKTSISNQISTTNEFKFNIQHQSMSHSTPCMPTGTRKITQNSSVKFREACKNLNSQPKQSRFLEVLESPPDQLLHPRKHQNLNYSTNSTSELVKTDFKSLNVKSSFETASVLQNSSSFQNLSSKNTIKPPTRSNLKQSHLPNNRSHVLASITPRPTPRTNKNVEAAKQLDTLALQNQHQTQIESNSKEIEFLKKFKMLTFFFWDLPPETIKKFQKLAESFGAKTISKFSLNETSHLVTDYTLYEHSTVGNRLRKFKEAGGKIWTSEKYLSIATQVKKCFDSRKSLNEIVVEEKLLGLSTSSKSETHSASNYHIFTGHFLLVEENSAAFRPIMAEEYSAEKPYPMFWIKNPIGHCGFVEYIASDKENECKQVTKIMPKKHGPDRTGAILHQATNSNASGIISGSIAALKTQEIVKSTKVEKLEQRVLHIQTKSIIKRKFVRTKSQRATGKAFYKKTGFCENCNVVYDEFIVHVKSDIHRQFAQDDSKFKNIDIIMDTLQRQPILGSNLNQDYTYCIAEWEYPQRQNRKRTNSFCKFLATSLDEEFPAIQFSKKRVREEITSDKNEGPRLFMRDHLSSPSEQLQVTEKSTTEENNKSNILALLAQNVSVGENCLSKNFEYNNDKLMDDFFTESNQYVQQYFAVETIDMSDETFEGGDYTYFASMDEHMYADHGVRQKYFEHPESSPGNENISNDVPSNNSNQFRAPCIS
ncbi:hypothetical protein HK096_002868 [Nowakowskiella sp. JEL0078]|nr:hypothetical protein HK096_002868 [Nowakowskiella sp. JEL0078]